MSTRVAEQLVKITRQISALIESEGGTSSHVAAVTIELPSSTFDALYAGMDHGYNLPPARNPRSIANEGTLNGIRIKRGATDATIREAAMRRNGMAREESAP